MKFRRLVQGLLALSLWTPALAQTAPATAPGGADPAAAKEPSPYPTLRPVSPRIDFGSHRPLSFLSDTMTLVNDGPAPLTLVKAIGECSCTDATILGKDLVLEPGEQVDILVAVEFPREMGLYTKQVLIYAEGYNLAFPVPFDFEVGYPIRINDGPRQAIVVDRVGTVTLVSTEKRPFRVWSINGAAPSFNGFDPARDAPRDNYILTYNWQEVPASDLPRWMVIETDHPGAETMIIPARIPGYRPILDKTMWHPMDEHITLGTVAPGEPVHVSVLFTGKAVMPGKSILATSSNRDIAVTVTNARRPDRGGGISIDFEFIPSRTSRGFISSVISVEYDGTQTAFDLFARVDPNLSMSSP